MRVGIFTNTYHPGLNGVVHCVDGIRRGLLQQGHQVALFAPRVPGYREEQPDVFRFASLALSRHLNYPIPIPYSGRLFRLIRQLDLSLIHSHHPFLLGEVAASFAREKGVPLVYTFHTQLEQYSHYIPLHQEVVKEMARVQLRRYLEKCDLVIAPSEGARAMLDSYAVSTPIVTLPNAIPTSRFQASPSLRWREQHGIPPEALLSLSVGRLGKEKSLDVLLRSFARLPQRSTHRLALVGDGPEAQSLRQLAAELGIADRVLFLGSIPYHEMPSIYASCDLFVMASTSEVKPLVLLEALASGLAVLAVAACGTSDTLRHQLDGWLCQPHQESVTQGWQTLLESPDLRQRLGQAARQTATLYSEEAYMSRLLELYERCVQLHRPRPRRGQLSAWGA